MYITFRNYKKEYNLLHNEYCTLHSAKTKVQTELINTCTILQNNNDQGNDFVAVRKAKDGATLLVFTSHYATVKYFLDIIIYMPAKRQLPIFRLTGRCTTTIEKKESLTFDYIHMEEEFRNNGIGTIAFNYMLDWSARENKSCIIVDLYWINLTAFECSLKRFLTKFNFKTFYLADSSVLAEKMLTTSILDQEDNIDKAFSIPEVPTTEKAIVDLQSKLESESRGDQTNDSQEVDVMNLFDLLPSTTQNKLLIDFQDMVKQAYHGIEMPNECIYPVCPIPVLKRIDTVKSLCFRNLII